MLTHRHPAATRYCILTSHLLWCEYPGYKGQCWGPWSWGAWPWCHSVWGPGRQLAGPWSQCVVMPGSSSSLVSDVTEQMRLCRVPLCPAGYCQSWDVLSLPGSGPSSASGSSGFCHPDPVSQGHSPGSHHHLASRLTVWADPACKIWN